VGVYFPCPELQRKNFPAHVCTVHIGDNCEQIRLLNQPEDSAKDHKDNNMTLEKHDRAETDQVGDGNDDEEAMATEVIHQLAVEGRGLVSSKLGTLTCISNGETMFCDALRANIQPHLMSHGR
jgi:hypothetical protein